MRKSLWIRTLTYPSKSTMKLSIRHMGGTLGLPDNPLANFVYWPISTVSFSSQSASWAEPILTGCRCSEQSRQMEHRFDVWDDR